MTVLLDPPRWPAHGRLWSHLASDESLAELHAFAAANGIPSRGFEGDHYDVPQERYAALVAAGAEPVETRVLLARLTASGLRLRKRKGDRGVSRVLGVSFPDGTVADIDLIASGALAPAGRVFAATVFVQDLEGHLAAVFSVRRQEWGPPGGWREAGESVAQCAVREVREETGLELDETALAPIGYERFQLRVAGDLARPGQDLLQVYAARLTRARPELRPQLADTSARAWLTPSQFAARCQDQFWWALFEANSGWQSAQLAARPQRPH